MTPDREQPNIRRKKREAARKKQQARRRRQIVTGIAGVLAALALCGVLIWVANKGKTPPVSGESLPGQAAPQGDAAKATDPGPETVIHIAAAGDLNVTDRVVSAGKNETGYDFAPVFRDVAPALSNADLTLVNFEGNLVGEPYGTSTASAPQEMVTALANAGVDVVQMANSYAISNGLLGLGATLDGLRQVGMEPVGAWKTNEEFRASRGYTIREVNGVRIAIVAFTKGMNNLGLPAGSEKCVNVLYEDYATVYSEVATSQITAILEDVARERPDFTIALLHWGSEYNDEISESQKSIRSLMLANGVDVIIGTHPHLVQQIDWDKEAGTLVAYSLGDFFGDGEESGSNYSLVLDLEITRDNVTGATRLTNYTYTPIYTVSTGASGNSKLRLLRIEPARKAYEANFLEKVSQEVYDSMTYALERIDQRIHPEETS